MQRDYIQNLQHDSTLQSSDHIPGDQRFYADTPYKMKSLSLLTT